MKQSEKIILVLVFLAAIYAVVDFSLTRQKKMAAKIQTQTDSQGLAELSAQVSGLSSEADRKIDRLATTINEPWPETIFVPHQVDFGNKKEEVEEPKEQKETKDAAIIELQTKANHLIYSGFLAMGSDLIAIINGMDYKIGEQINGFTLIAISQEAIQVSQQDANFTVPAVVEKDPNLSAK